MLKILGIVTAIILSLVPPDLRGADNDSNALQTAQPDSSGFVPVDPTQLEKVSGKSLMVAAYAVILGILLFYTITLLGRERVVRKRTFAVEQRLKMPDESS